MRVCSLLAYISRHLLEIMTEISKHSRDCHVGHVRTNQSGKVELNTQESIMKSIAMI